MSTHGIEVRGIFEKVPLKKIVIVKTNLFEFILEITIFLNGTFFQRIPQPLSPAWTWLITFSLNPLPPGPGVTGGARLAPWPNIPQFAVSCEYKSCKQMSFSWYIRAGVSHQNSLLLCFTFSFRYNAKLTYRTFSLALFGCFYCCCLNTGHGKACVSVCPSNFSTSIRICMGCIDVKPSAARGARILRSCEHDKLSKNCLHMDRYVFLIRTPEQSNRPSLPI